MPPIATVDRRPLSERWRPGRLSEVVGNRPAVAELEEWGRAWAAPRVPARRAVLLVGPPGVGKTSAAAALATDQGWAMVEMNASEARNQGAIERVAGRASITRSLEATGSSPTLGRTLVLLDEADCLSGGRTSEGTRPVREPLALRAFLEGRYGTVGALNAAWGLAAEGKVRPFDSWGSVPKSPGTSAWAKLPTARRDLDDWREAGRSEETGDRGGLGAIARLVRTTLQPLVLTVNDERPLTRYSPVFRTSVRTIRFGPVGDADVAGRLRQVARAEHLAVPAPVVDTIVARARGDLRAALNDLEAISAAPAGLPPQELLGPRDLASDFAELTEEVLSRPRYYRSVEVQDRLDAPPDDLLPWVEENIPWFAPDERHRDAALAVIATAELFLARARRWRTYGLWSYASELLTGGVALAVRERAATGRGHAAFPRFLGEMGRSRASRAVRETVVGKLGTQLHLSRNKSRAIALPFVEALLGLAARGPRSDQARGVARALARELALTREEVGALLGAEPDSPAVRALVPEPEDEAERSPPVDHRQSSAADRGDVGRPPATGRPSVQRRLGD